MTSSRRLPATAPGVPASMGGERAVMGGPPAPVPSPTYTHAMGTVPSLHTRFHLLSLAGSADCSY